MIDQLPERQPSGLAQFVETIVDLVNTALRNAPLDDEPETDEEKTAMSEAASGSGTMAAKASPHAEAMRRLGLE
ncbi:MAG: hypothetical protein IPP47_19185 [Bryobacterales bacterium]|nr:hypothetical protein [Bryobacterales bacterium]